MMHYEYKVERHPERPCESRVLVTWAGYGWWHKLGKVVEYATGQVEAWPVWGLGDPYLCATHEEAVEYLCELWKARQRRCAELKES